MVTEMEKKNMERIAEELAQVQEKLMVIHEHETLNTLNTHA